jgi:hypothetical protein
MDIRARPVGAGSLQRQLLTLFHNPATVHKWIQGGRYTSARSNLLRWDHGESERVVETQ